MSVKLNYLKAELSELNSTKRILLQMKGNSISDSTMKDLQNVNRFIRLKRIAIKNELTSIQNTRQ